MRAYQLLEEMRVAATDKDDSVFDPLWKLLDSYSMFQRSSHKGRVTRVAHLKTHKTASTTLSSIMFRFGARNKLRMFRPKVRLHPSADERSSSSLGGCVLAND